MLNCPWKTYCANGSVRAEGEPFTEDAVREAVGDAGFASDSIQTRDDHRDVLFGIGVEGGCVFGAVTTEAVSIDVGGYIMDGGCLASVGH